MTIQSLIQSAKALLADVKQLTPAVAKIINDVRGLSHAAGELTAEHEKDFQNLAARFAGYITKSSLAPLPTVRADGTAILPLEAPLRTDGPTLEEYVAAGYAPVASVKQPEHTPAVVVPTSAEDAAAQGDAAPEAPAAASESVSAEAPVPPKAPPTP